MKLEIRDALTQQERLKFLGFIQKFCSKYAILELTNDIDYMWSKKLFYEVKKAIKKASRENLWIRQDVSVKAVTNIFYPMYLNWMKMKPGAPPLPLNFFLNCRKHLENKIKLFIAGLEDEVMACLMGFTCGKRIYITNIVSTGKFLEKRPNDLLHWEFIKWGCENGYRFFDFGNARYEGQIHFKRKWGCDFRDYYQYYFSTNSANICRKSPINPESLKFRILSKLWRLVVPLNQTERLGSIIRKKLGA